MSGIRILRGRVAIRELLDTPKRIVLPGDYHDRHVRDTKSHRGMVLAMGAPALTRKGAPVAPGFGVGDIVHYVWALAGCEQSRTSLWRDGERCVWVAQEEVIAVEVDPRTS